VGQPPILGQAGICSRGLSASGDARRRRVGLGVVRGEEALVVVGDVQTDSRIEALLAASQEAMVNAAKHSGATTARVFAEVTSDAVSVFIRDRGQGFDPSSIADDRAGVRDSIQGRMQRVGGTATIRTTVGEGTEVALALPKVSE